MAPRPQFSRACAGWPAVKVVKIPHHVHVMQLYRWSSADSPAADRVGGGQLAWGQRLVLAPSTGIYTLSDLFLPAWLSIGSAVETFYTDDCVKSLVILETRRTTLRSVVQNEKWMMGQWCLSLIKSQQMFCNLKVSATALILRPLPPRM